MEKDFDGQGSEAGEGRRNMSEQGLRGMSGEQDITLGC